MDLENGRLEKLQKLFKKMPQVLAVYFYGSRIKGYEAKNSDLDIAVVVDDIKGIDYGKLYLQVTKIIQHIELDLRVATLKNDPTYLSEVIKGQCVYQRSMEDRLNFETKVLRGFDDGKHIRDIYYHYLKQSFGVK